MGLNYKWELIAIQEFVEIKQGSAMAIMTRTGFYHPNWDGSEIEPFSMG